MTSACELRSAWSVIFTPGLDLPESSRRAAPGFRHHWPVRMLMSSAGAASSSTSRVDGTLDSLPLRAFREPGGDPPRDPELASDHDLPGGVRGRDWGL